MAEAQARNLRQENEDLTRRRHSRAASPHSDPPHLREDDRTVSLRKQKEVIRVKRSEIIGGTIGNCEELADEDQ